MERSSYRTRRIKTKTKSLLSDIFVSKLSLSWGAKSNLPEKFGIKKSTFENWVLRMNKAPIEHTGIFAIAELIGCPKDKIFEE